MSNSTSTAVREEIAKTMRLTDVFPCGSRRRKLYLATCLDDFMNANALRVRSMVCFECPQGAEIREHFAADADTEGLLDSEIWGSLITGFEEEEG